MDVWKIWDVRTCLVNFRSVVSTAFKFYDLIEASAAIQPPPSKYQIYHQDHELPKSLANVIIHADIRCICAQIAGLLRDPVAYQDVLNARDDDAQQLLDLLQDVSE
jgi:hypothetical protein